MPRKILLAALVAAPALAFGCQPKPAAVAPAPSASVAVVRGRSVLRYLPADCPERLFIDGTAVSSLVDVDARKIILESIRRTDSKSYPIAPWIDPLLPAANLATPIHFELAVCGTLPYQVTAVVIESDHYANLGVLEADLAKTADVIQLPPTSARFEVHRDHLGALEVLRFSLNKPAKEGWAALVAPNTLVISFEPTASPDKFSAHASTWQLDPAMIAAYAPDAAGTTHWLALDHQSVIDLDFALPAALAPDQKQIERFADMFYGYWPELRSNIRSWSFEGSPPVLHTSIARKSFATQKYNPEAAMRKDLEIFCEPWKSDAEARKFAPDASIDETRKALIFANAIDNSLSTPCIRDVFKAIDHPGIDLQYRPSIMRTGARDCGVPITACPFVDSYDWRVLCHNKLDDGLALLSKDSPVARDVAAQKPKDRAAYVAARAKEVYIDDCPMAPRGP